MSAKVLVLGSSGLLGASLVPMLRSQGYEIATHGRRDGTEWQVDLNDPQRVKEMLEKVNPRVVVNLVALTDVDRCEAEPHQAYRGNVQTVENIAHWMKEPKNAGCYLVHISTDQVYDGAGPHSERQVTLKNYYAFSKYAGEIVAANVRSAVLRTNFFGRSRCANRTSFTDWIFRSLMNNEALQMFDDVRFTPLSMLTLCEMVALTIRKEPVGLFNVGSREGMSKADFAFAYADAMQLSAGAVSRTSTDRVSFLKAYRPKDMRMDCSKFEHVLGVKLPLLEDEIRRAAKEYRETT